jgi:membrane-associated protein
MELIRFALDFILHIDIHMGEIISRYGLWTYVILFLIVFCETGLVVTPFLPGDSLLFAAGTFAALGALNPWWLCVVLSISAIAGDTINYWIGASVGHRVFHKEKVRFFNKAHLERTHNFYEKYGGKTIIIARFVPIVRTFAPFVAGMGSMTYWKFISYNVAGGIAWILICVLAGFYFGNLPLVKENFAVVIVAIIIISVLPGAFEIARQKLGRRKTPQLE